MIKIRFIAGLIAVLIPLCTPHLGAAATPSKAAAKANQVYYVEERKVAELLEYDAAATLECVRGEMRAQPNSKVVFLADGHQSFNWSRKNPDLFYQNVGWTNCKAFRRLQ